jgi:hypothetical protein
MESSVCIVGGCGHIGLPLGMALAEVGVPSEGPYMKLCAA